MTKLRDNVVLIDESDELAAVLDGVLNSSGSTVYVILGDNTHITNNILNLRLLKREAESIGKRVILVTQNARVKNLAERAGIRVQDVLESIKAQPKKSPSLRAYTGTAKKIITDIIPPSSAAGKAEPPLFKAQVKLQPQTEEVRPVENSGIRQKFLGGINPLQRSGEELLRSSDYTGAKRRIALPKLSRFFSASIFKYVARNPKWTFVCVGAVSVLTVLLFVVLTVLPRVTLSLTPQSVEDTISFTLVLDSNISSVDFERNIAPAQILEERGEDTSQYDASGTAQVKESATGVIRIFNEFSSSSQTLVANTRFLSSDGKIFRTTETIVVPGAKIEDGKIISSSTTVNVRADESGAEFNIGPSTFSIPGFKGTPKFLSFFGKSEESMSGGFSGVRAVVTEQDAGAARVDLQNGFLSQLGSELRNKIPVNLTVIEDSFSQELIKFDIDTASTADSNKFVVHATGEAKVFLVDTEDINSAIQHNFITSSEFNKDFELSHNRTVKYIVKEADFIKGFARATINVTQIFNRVVDVDMLLNEIRGKNEVEVRKILGAKEELASAQVRFWPFWVHSVPSDTQDITVEVNKK